LIKISNNGHISCTVFDLDKIETTLLEWQSNHLLFFKRHRLLAFLNNGCKYFNITGTDGEWLKYNKTG